jgi:pimeloyl-ACP methyl ester carboxylesterase
MNEDAGALDPVLEARILGGVRLHFVERGRGSDVVFLHGGLGDCLSWTPQLDALAPHFHSMAYSRRHHYPNQNVSSAASESIADDVNDLDGFMQSQATACAHLVGTSYGALVALAFAMRHPKRVRSIILAEPPLHGWARRTPAGAQLHDSFMRGVWRPAIVGFATGNDLLALQILVDGMWGRPYFDSLSPLRRSVVLRNAGAMKHLTQRGVAFPELDRSDVMALTAPAFLIEGEHTSALHRCVMQELALAWPDAPRAVVPDAGHASSAENPAGFNAAALAFLLAH